MREYWMCGKGYKSKRIKKSLMDRFMSKVSKTSECWNWVGSKNTEGYGNFYYKNVVDKAHRASYEIFVRKIPFGLCVLHKCDNPKCVRPDHLFTGTKQDNANDAMAKGRTRIFQSNAGEKNPACKLTQEKVDSIRKEFIPRVFGRHKLAKKYEVSSQTISDILYGKSWVEK